MALLDFLRRKRDYNSELQRIFSGKFDFTQEEQTEINGVFNLLKAKMGSDVVVDPKFRDGMVALGLHNYAQSLFEQMTAIAHSQPSIEALRALSERALLAYAKAYVVSRVPIFLCEIGLILEMFSDSKCQKFYRTFLEEQKSFVPDVVTKPLLKTMGRNIEAMIKSAQKSVSDGTSSANQ